MRIEAMSRLKREAIVFLIALGAAVIATEFAEFVTAIVSDDAERIAFWRGYGGGTAIALVICKSADWTRDG